MTLLGGLDGACLHLETPATPMRVVSLSPFALPPRYRGGFYARNKRQIACRPAPAAAPTQPRAVLASTRSPCTLRRSTMPDTVHAMTRVDTAWLRMDTNVNLMMIVGVWLLAPAIRFDALCERIGERLLPYLRFRQRVAQGALASRWVPNDSFDLARHVVVETLPRRNGQSKRSALQQRMGDLASTPLNPARPLWQFHVTRITVVAAR